MKSGESVKQLIEELAGHESDLPLVSLYLPTALEFDERSQNEIRVKNGLAAAEKELEARGIQSRDIRKLLDPVREASVDDTIWQAHDSGFAFFTCAEFARHTGLPVAVHELTVVASRFHVKPLFAALDRSQSFYVLVLSQNAVRLFLGNRDSLSLVELGDDVPKSLMDAKGYELTDRRHQFHTVHRDENAPIFHGQGAGEDDTDVEIAQYLAAVDNGLKPYWGTGDVPVLLAGVDSLVDEFRRISGHEGIADEQISGNAEHLSGAELHEKAWPLVRERLEEHTGSVLERIVHSDAGVPVSRQLQDVVRAASDGRVDTVFVALDRECWGRYDETQREVISHEEAEAGDYDLLDRAAADSFLKGGEVHAIPAEHIPGPGTAIARLRW